MPPLRSAARGLAVRKIIAIPNYANVMVGERRMHLGQRVLGHVTAHTVAGGDRAATRRVVSGGGERTRSDMTRQAFGVVGSRGCLQWFVRVVTRNASDAGVTLAPALTLFQPVSGKSNRLDALHAEFKDIPRGAVTRTAKINGILRTQVRRIHDHARADGIGGGCHRNMGETRTMAPFAADS